MKVLQDPGQEYLDTLPASIPLERQGTVADVGNAALSFALDEAACITVQQIVLDGVQTTRNHSRIESI
jgi:3-oxoacyl-[acyl-carrier protein] reductase